MKFRNLSLITLIPFLFACSTKAPDCADQKTKQTLLDLVNKQANSYISSDIGKSSIAFAFSRITSLADGKLEYDASLKDVKLSIDNIKEDKYDEKVDKHYCSADLVSEYKGNKNNLEMKFTSQMANKGDKHIVEARELSSRDYGSIYSVLISALSKEAEEKQKISLNNLRKEIGDEKIDDYVKSVCEGIEQNESRCSLGRKAKEAIIDERRKAHDDKKQFFLDNRDKLAVTYNLCGDTVYKLAGRPPRDGKWQGPSGIDSALADLAKNNPKLSDDCKAAASAASALNIDTGGYFTEILKIKE